jgi:RecB family endonuclease NucS
VLRDWHAVKTHFVKSSFEVPDDCWRELITLANNDPDLLAKEATDGLHHIRLEREIQRRLIERPELLAQAGLRGLTFVKHEFLFANGRRADLVYTQGFGPLKRDIIVELKRGEVGPRAIEQVNDYADQLSRDPRRSRLRPRTVVIGEKLQAEAEKLVGRGSRGKPRFYALAELKIERL